MCTIPVPSPRAAAGLIVLCGVAMTPTVAAAVPLTKAACKALETERLGLVKQGVQKTMAKGPQWAQSNLDETQIARIKRYLSLEEQLRFRCAPGLVPGPKRQKTVAKAKPRPDASVPLPLKGRPRAAPVDGSTAAPLPTPTKTAATQGEAAATETRPEPASPQPMTATTTPPIHLRKAAAAPTPPPAEPAPPPAAAPQVKAKTEPESPAPAPSPAEPEKTAAIPATVPADAGSADPDEEEAGPELPVRKPAPPPRRYRVKRKAPVVKAPPEVNPLNPTFDGN